MTEPYMASVILFAGSFAPKYWQYCNGQLWSIAQNSALFSLLGTTYGGDGVVTFALPDFRGRTAVGTGSGGRFPEVVQGEIIGSNSVSILVTNLPAHSHAIVASNVVGTTDDPTGNILGKSHVATTGDSVSSYDLPSTANAIMAPQAIQPTGGSQPIDIQNPLLGMSYIIATQGIYPSRN